MIIIFYFVCVLYVYILSFIYCVFYVILYVILFHVILSNFLSCDEIVFVDYFRSFCPSS